MSKLDLVLLKNPDRTSYIGSTDARVIASGDWLDLYLQKRGEQPHPNLDHVWKARLGLVTENLHREYWMWSGARIQKMAPSPQPYAIAGLPDHHATSLDGWWATESVDRQPINEGMPFEMKHTHGGNDLRSAAEFYMPQIQWQMHCTGAEGVMFSIVCGNSEPVRAMVERDQDYINRLVAQVDVFWECVVEGVPPSFRTEAAAVEASDILKIAAGSVKIDGRKPYDMTTNNQWREVEDRYADEKAASDRFKNTDKELRGLIPADASIVTGKRVQLKRDARGAFRATVLETQA